jgi:tetratricopeptide (TPR) repeat protein
MPAPARSDRQELVLSGMLVVVAVLREYVDLTAALGGEYLVVHGGFHFSACLDRVRAALYETTARPVEYGERHRVPLVIENMNRLRDGSPAALTGPREVCENESKPERREAPMRTVIRVLTSALGVALAASASVADMSPPTPVPAAPPPAVTAESHYNQGLEAHKRGDFARAARAFEAAIKIRAAFPEAWNGLGFALRQQKKYPEAVNAYERALGLRPNYVEALEYLGEAYVQMGKLDDARRVLSRLEPLDRDEAGKLRAAIDAKK